MKDFLAECRRRRVFRLAGMYIVGCWAVLQVADLAFESWDVSPHAIRYVWIVAFVGFPIALVLAWRFDIVGGRIQRTEDSTLTGDLSLHFADYAILTALAAIAIAASYGIGTGLSGNLEGTKSSRDAEAVPDRDAAVDQRSIAVLPFSIDGASPDEVRFLADGIHDELLTRLSRISALSVTSRTSVQRYRDTSRTIPEIGRELGVARVLEGRVQVFNEQIRVNVQLIYAAKDEHVWADKFDGRLVASDLFAIQSDIVEAIAVQLEARITPGENVYLATTPTDDLAAYSAYLKGRNHADSESIESLTEAGRHFQQALDLDPEFALAYVGLADTYLHLADNFWAGMQPEESTVLAEPLIVRALAIDPQLGEAYASLGLVRQLQNDFAAAEDAYVTAMRLRPNYARVFRLLGRMKLRLGDRESVLEWLNKALALDPHSVPVNFDIARYHDITGNFDEALARYHRVIEYKPDYAFAYVYIAAIHYLVYGRADESLVWYQKAVEHDPLSPSLASAQAVAYLELGDTDAAQKYVAHALQLDAHSFWPVWTSLLLNYRIGDMEGAERDARRLLERYPRNSGALHLLRNRDIATGRLDAAAARYSRSYRELVDSEVPTVNLDNYVAATDLAHVLMRLGQTERARDLLAGVLEYTARSERHGTEGYWITDARAYAALGQNDKALRALHAAVEEGWRVLAWFYLDHDPNLESIRGTQEFRRLRQLVANDMSAQAVRVEQLYASGDLRR